MLLRTAPLALLLALLPAAFAGSSSSLVGLASPLLLWSNQGLVGRGDGPHVSYQVRGLQREGGARLGGVQPAVAPCAYARLTEASSV